MRPTIPLLITAALVVGTAVSMAPASAAAATCRGVPATIEASGVLRVDGTEGDDVIVAHDVSGVRALGGDDLVCVIGSVVGVVDAGTGNDVVDATGRTGRTTTFLGEGDDTFLGSAAVDEVHAGTQGRVDTGRDVVDAGPAGADQDFVVSGRTGLPNPDEVVGRLVWLDWAGDPTPTSRAEGGTGSTFALGTGPATRLAIDVPARTLTTSGSGAALTVRGFSTFSVRASRDLERFTFRGSNRDEALLVPPGGRTVLRAAMGGGDDTMQVGTYAKGSWFRGGHGRDRVYVQSSARLDLDLRQGVLTKRSGRKVVTHEVTGFEDAAVGAPTVRLTGTHGSNALEVDACRATVQSLGGRDTTSALPSTGSGSPCVGGRQMRFFGGHGDDRMFGSSGNDLLVGGPGRDQAVGGGGRDTCGAEIRRECEVRR
ncbi:hypothetical protein SAMN04489844_1864 [Nocardioides exalbidus]|uniref:Hemolysin-type calcium-binding repeat-containing protein n=1 Tax=Nocardioides exalbidus TaxID=402596 RepID=A0A1H4QK94_9ACTN|nr:hypothetical protein [Nocardioides exalbidus]SEC20040.1 hypothetical protein SAMN04489844_1864 [Nocardioides exalbidus]